MGKVVKFFSDRLANALSGRGTTVDRRTQNLWFFDAVDASQAETGYRTNWLYRKVVDIPAKDMTREWRAWQAKGSSIEGIEKEEERLGLQYKAQRALILSRLFGGGALILATGDGDPMKPLDPESVQKGGLRAIHVMSRHELTLGEVIRDPASEWFKQPSFFQIRTAGMANDQQGVKLHPSRVVPFIGQPLPEGSTIISQPDSWYWGDPIMLSINEAIEDAMTASGGFASLIDEAKIDVIGIPDLMSHWATDEHEERLMDRLALAQRAKSTHRALIRDAAEEWEQRQVTWAGMPEILMAYMELVAGAADIPVTRLLGQSPKGLQSTGKGEQQDYHDKVEADQAELLGPQLKRIDELLIRSALGSRPDDIYFEFNPLDEPDEAAESEIDKRVAETLRLYSDMAIFDDEALAAIAKNRMIESGRFPGCEQAFEEHPDVPEDDPDPDAGKTAAQLVAEKAEALRSAGAIDDAQAVALVTDAKPRTLYVSRKLSNTTELLAWAKAQGIPEPMDAGSLHVTVCYSKTPLDWLKVDAEDWNQEKDGTITVPPGGARLVERLGEKGAVVLLFASSRLAWRHEQIMRAGGSHDFEEYQPHITVSWNVPADFDLDAVEPYRGKLVFGPEIFAEIDEEWTPPGPGSKKKLIDYDPNQPRDPGGEGGGQWVEAGGGSDNGGYKASEGSLSTFGVDEADRERAEKISKHFDGRKLTTAEVDIVSDYTVAGYKDENAALRSGKVTPFAKKLDKIIASERVSSPLTVYRGLFGSVSPADDLPVGSIISDMGFISTSADPSVGAKFAGWAVDSGEQPLLLRVAVPEGATALHINPLRGFNAAEHEVVLPRNARMRVLSAPKTETFTAYAGTEFAEDRPVTVVDVELVP